MREFLKGRTETARALALLPSQDPISNGCSKCIWELDFERLLLKLQKRSNLLVHISYSSLKLGNPCIESYTHSSGNFLVEGKKETILAVYEDCFFCYLSRGYVFLAIWRGCPPGTSLSRHFTWRSLWGKESQSHHNYIAGDECLWLMMTPWKCPFLWYYLATDVSCTSFPIHTYQYT